MNVTEIYTSRLDKDLERFCKEYADAVRELGEAGDDEARRKHAYELAHARAYMAAEGTIPQRQAQTTIDCEKEYLASLLAERKREAIKARLRWVDKELDILRTRAATMRSEMEFTRLPEPAWRPRAS